MTTIEFEIEKTVERVLANLGDPSSWQQFRGYPNGLALCIIDSVQSLRLSYKVVDSVIDRYRANRADAGANPDLDGCTQLIENIQSAGGAAAWSVAIGTNTMSPGTKTLKAQAMLEVALALRDIGIETNADMSAARADSAGRAAVRRTWLAVKGLGVASWDYVLMLSGEDGVKADTMICRFVGKAVGTDPVSPDRAKAAVKGSARRLGVAEGALDRAIWRFESGREVAKGRAADN